MCTPVRKALQHDFQCSMIFREMKRLSKKANHGELMRAATFCPCPGGDSPGAKRMFDSIFAGCIPVILSYDFVWPFTKEAGSAIPLDASDFSLRLEAKDYAEPILNSTCQPINITKRGLQGALEEVTVKEISRLRKGLEKAKRLYAWYEDDPSLPANPLKEKILPTGGAAHMVVRELAERAGGVRWPACEEELKAQRRPEAKQFVC